MLEQMCNVLMESEDFDYYLDWISDQITKLREEAQPLSKSLCKPARFVREQLWMRDGLTGQD